MDQKRYSMKDVQRITQLSPLVLQEFLKKYQHQISIEVVKGPQGEETYMDHASFERLMFLKQLELRQAPSHAEIVNQLQEPSAKTICIEGSEAGPAVFLKGALDTLSSEVTNLSSSLHQILMRYSQVLKDLNQCRAENRHMQKELGALKARQNLIISQLKQDGDGPGEEPKEKTTIN